MALARLTRRVTFSAAHRYYRPEWSEEENRRVFGACANPHGHGHNYILEATVENEIDPLTGFSVDLPVLDGVLERITGVLDHQHVNHAVEAFAPGGLVPTCENLLTWLWPRVEAGIATHARLIRLRLHEEPGLFVDYYGGGSARVDV
jgi:6-pyruvoyltetrahydropterin/6-carboxytetrahydropterin synthase